MELAKFFASLGFKYDSATLGRFEKDLDNVKRRMQGFSSDISAGLNGATNASKRASKGVDQFSQRIKGSYAKVKPSVKQMEKDLERVNRVLDKANLSPDIRKNYEDLHQRIFSAIEREEAKRAQATAKEAAARQKVIDQAHSDAIKEESLRERLRKRREVAEAREERERHRERIRNLRYEYKEQKRHRREIGGWGKAAAAGLGIGGALSIKESIDEYRSYQGTMQGLTAVHGNEKDAKTDFDWLVGLSNKLGMFAGDLTKGYTSLAANTKGAGIDDKTTKDMFEAVTSYASTLHLSRDDTNGVLRALSQMVGKGKLSAEEVRQQAGERLPGFIPAAAKALGFGEGEKGTAKLFSEMQAGHLTAKQLFAGLPKELMAMANAGGALEKAMNNSSAAIGRLRTNVWLANKTFNESGFDNAVKTFSNTLSDTLQKMNPVWIALGKLANEVGNAISTPIELFGTLSQVFGDVTKEGETVPPFLKRLGIALTILLKPLRRVAIALFLIPAGLSALNDLIEKFREGKLNEKSWGELAVQIGLATAALAVIVGMVAKVFRLTKAIKALSGAFRTLGGSSGSSRDRIKDFLDDLDGDTSRRRRRRGRARKPSKGPLGDSPMDPEGESGGRDKKSPKSSEGRSKRSGGGKFKTYGKIGGGFGTLGAGIDGYEGFTDTDQVVANWGDDSFGSKLANGVAKVSTLGGLLPNQYDDTVKYDGWMKSMANTMYSAITMNFDRLKSIKSPDDNVADALSNFQRFQQQIPNSVSQNSDMVANALSTFNRFSQAPNQQNGGSQPAAPQAPSNVTTINRLEFNVNGGDEGKIRKLFDDILSGHIRTAASSNPPIE